ncbi:MAG: proton-conducting transporter membrane subunit [Bacteroidetes bacterium]|nr:proton-conducting transporter membrane subunit [Bacteroidota bacterium]
MQLLYYYILTVVLVAGMLLIRNRATVNVLTGLFLAGQMGLCVVSWMNKGSDVLSYFTFDALAVLFLTLLTLLSITTVIHGFVNLKDNTTRRYQQYHAALAGLIASITGATLANNLTVVWVFVEATTLTASVLIYHEKNKLTLEAVWKYIFVCSTGIAIAYFGILFLGLGMQGNARFDLSFSAMSELVTRVNPLYLKIAFLFVLVGYSTKMELFPMHTAGVDANSVAQPQIGAFISTAMVNLGFVSFFRVYRMLYHTSIFSWMNHILLIVGLLSVLTAAGYMLKARHVKRMLAYSTLENMGIMAIALGTGDNGYYAAILILVVHSLIKSGLFYQLSQLFRTLHTYMLKETGNYFILNPPGALVLLSGTLLILAIPPSGLFLPEFLTFLSLAESGNWLVLILLLFFLCFVVYAFATRMMHVLFSNPVEDHPEPVMVRPYILELAVQWIMFAAAILLCFYQPPFLQQLMKEAVQMF